MKTVTKLLVLMLLFGACKNNCPELVWHEDLDGDGLGNPDVTQSACEQPEGYVQNGLDDDDSAADDTDPDDGNNPGDGNDGETSFEDLFLSEALNQDIEVVTCTLSDGTVTDCYKLVVNTTPEDHDVGPWCPETINDVGGIWEDPDDDVLYTVDVDYLNKLEAKGWDIINADGSVNVTTDEELTKISTQETQGWTFEEAEADGIVNHCIQATPQDIEWTLYIPVTPVNAAEPTYIDLGFGNATGVSLNGILFFPPEPSPRITKYQNIAPLDEHGGHTGFSYDYHYHRVLNVPSTETDIIGYMRDGYPLYSDTEPDGSEPTGLDDCRGHDHDDLGYHYHSTSESPYIVNCLTGEYGDIEK